MASLPANWESDYDGTRWFYRYVPTGLTQFHFPKPGDEFPQFLDSFAPIPDLAPEERLESQQQLKRRGSNGGRSQPSAARKKNGDTMSATLADMDDHEGFGGFLSYEQLMYMPGAYNDISPLQDDDDGPAAGTYGNEGRVKTRARKESGASAVASVLTTPLPSTNQPAMAGLSPTALAAENATVVMGPGIVVEVQPNINSPQSPGVPLLDSRQLPFSPRDIVAELYSESTGLSREETNPAPIELPDHAAILAGSRCEPDYHHAFDMAPIELPTDMTLSQHRARGSADEQKTLQAKRSEPYRCARAPLPEYMSMGDQGEDPPPRMEQSSPARPDEHRDHMIAPEISSQSAQGGYRPFTPSPSAAATDWARESLVVPGRLTVSESQDMELNVGGKRTCRTGDIVPHVPFVLKPARGLGSTEAWQQGKSGPEAQRAKADGGAGSSGSVAHAPSVLKPGRGRPLSEVIESMQAAQQHVQNPPRSAAIDRSGSPQLGISRTNTLPVHIPSLPFMPGAQTQVGSGTCDTSGPLTQGDHDSGNSRPNSQGAAATVSPCKQPVERPFQEWSVGSIPENSSLMPKPLKLSVRRADRQNAELVPHEPGQEIATSPPRPPKEPLPSQKVGQGPGGVPHRTPGPVVHRPPSVPAAPTPSAIPGTPLAPPAVSPVFFAGVPIAQISPVQQLQATFPVPSTDTGQHVVQGQHPFSGQPVFERQPTPPYSQSDHQAATSQPPRAPLVHMNSAPLILPGNIGAAGSIRPNTTPALPAPLGQPPPQKPRNRMPQTGAGALKSSGTGSPSAQSSPGIPGLVAGFYHPLLAMAGQKPPAGPPQPQAPLQGLQGAAANINYLPNPPTQLVQPLPQGLRPVPPPKVTLQTNVNPAIRPPSAGSELLQSPHTPAINQAPGGAAASGGNSWLGKIINTNMFMMGAGAATVSVPMDAIDGDAGSGLRIDTTTKPQQEQRQNQQQNTDVVGLGPAPRSFAQASGMAMMGQRGTPPPAGSGQLARQGQGPHPTQRPQQSQPGTISMHSLSFGQGKPHTRHPRQQQEDRSASFVPVDGPEHAGNDDPFDPEQRADFDSENDNASITDDSRGGYDGAGWGIDEDDW